MFRHIIDLTTAANMENIILTDATLTTTTKCGVQVQYLRMDNVLYSREHYPDRRGHAHHHHHQVRSSGTVPRNGKFK